MGRRPVNSRASLRYLVSPAAALLILGAVAVAQEKGTDTPPDASPPPENAVEMNLDVLKTLRNPPETPAPPKAEPASPATGEPAAEDMPTPVAKPPVPPPPPPAPPLPANSEAPAAPPPIVPEDVTSSPEETESSPATAAMRPAPKELKDRRVRILFIDEIPALTLEAAQTLDQLAAEVKEVDLRIELYAYAGTRETPPSDSRRLALKRAIAVRDHLIEQHIDPARIDLHVLGPANDDGPSERVDIRFLVP